jgi:hypothetical protein
MPRFERVPQFQLDALRRDAAVHRKTELEMRRKPRAFKRIAGARNLG